MTDAPRARLPWLLIAASVLLAVLLAYTFFVGYLPAKRRVAGLERELRDLYSREAQLHSKVAQSEQRHAQREQRLRAITAERDALARRLQELEGELGAVRRQRR